VPRVVAQFLVAGGFTRAVDAWIVDLEPRWQLTVLALAQLAIAFGQAYLADEPSARRVRASVAGPRIELDPRRNPHQ